MDPLVEKELAKVAPSVPLRASTTHVHHTWAKTFYSRPDLYIQPQTTEEIQKVVNLARTCHRRLVVVGSGHSPSDLTCTSSWIVNLDHYNRILELNKDTRVVVMQAGIRLYELQRRVKEQGLLMPNLGSIDHQSIAGVLATGGHGSSTRHGIFAQSVLQLKIVLPNGRIVSCSPESNIDLFRAAAVSLGALGIITEVTFKMDPFFNVEWSQSLHPLEELLAQWEKGLWTKHEFTRLWWMPYMKRALWWRADKTDKPHRPPVANWWSGSVGFHGHQVLMYVAQWVPSLLPAMESFLVKVQFGSKDRVESTAVQDGHTGLMTDALYSQLVNEWAIPLHRGPEAIRRLSAWLNGDDISSRIPFSSKGVNVHGPIEVRVTDSSTTSPRPYLDMTVDDGPTLFFNATLFRPYHCEPPCRKRYYEAFEYLMKELGGRPHWAKNFSTVTRDDFQNMYPKLNEWLRVRNDVDPDGMFVGDWHRRNLLSAKTENPTLSLEERKIKTTLSNDGGQIWSGVMPAKGLTPHTSEESFEMMHGVESEKSSPLHHPRTRSDDEKAE